MPETIRRHIRELLALLADPEQQLAYARDVPIAQVPAELLCMWFDDLYHPAGFGTAFSADECAALAAFDRDYAAAATELGDPANVAELHAHPTWPLVMQSAAEALRAIPPLRR